MAEKENTKENPLDKIRRKRRIFRAVSVVVILYTGIQVASTQVQIGENQKKLQELETKVMDQTALNGEYEYLLEKGNDPDYMEKRARDDKSLQMVYPGEQVFYDTTDD